MSWNQYLNADSLIGTRGDDDRNYSYDDNSLEKATQLVELKPCSKSRK